MDSRAFYDDFVDRQLRAGVNDRHRAIRDHLVNRGLSDADRVLEIGAGVGTLTSLLLREMKPDGKLVAVELSPKSADAARERLGGDDRSSFLSGDILEMELEALGTPFDLVVMADVIEHIPLERHPELFRRLAKLVAPRGYLLLHYPDPDFLAWRRETGHEGLQLVEESVHADVLTSNAYGAGFRLRYLETYAIWFRGGDYQIAVLSPGEPRPEYEKLERPSPSLMRRIGSRIRVFVDGVFGGARL